MKSRVKKRWAQLLELEQIAHCSETQFLICIRQDKVLRLLDPEDLTKSSGKASMGSWAPAVLMSLCLQGWILVAKRWRPGHFHILVPKLVFFTCPSSLLKEYLLCIISQGGLDTILRDPREMAPASKYLPAAALRWLPRMAAPSPP